MALSIRQMMTMSRLLDESLPLSAPERRTWLDALAPEFHDLLPALEEALLPSAARAAGGDTLGTLPKFRQLDPEGRAAGVLPGMRLGPYELIRPLGTGGMAEVWLAHRIDGAFEREVALKLPLLAPFRGDLEQRFAREREILASLSHPNIALLLDAGFASSGQPYLALEYVIGRPLTTHCDEHGLSIRARLELFQQVLRAVQYAHTHLVIHRDLKPSNILVTEEGRVQLLDFGIAKLLSDGEARETELTRLSGRALTLDYAAPEQIAGAPITTATDVYSLGVILYSLLTAERPYRLKREARGALEEAILNEEPLAPSRMAAGGVAAAMRGVTARKLAGLLKGDLDAIALKALKKPPGERYVTADAFEADIARYLRGEVVLAQRDRVVYRAAKFMRRHWVGIAAAGVLLLSLAAGLLATAYEARLASAERDAALQAQMRSLTQTAAARLRDADVAGAMNAILEVLPQGGRRGAYTPEALSVFHEARVADAQILALSGHGGVVWSAAFSADGGRVVTSSWDETARIWDMATSRELVRLVGHTGRLVHAQFSPDGRRVVTAAYDNTARVWDAATGRELLRLVGHSRQVMSAIYSPDGRRIATVSTDKTARIWDAETGAILRVLDDQPGRLTSAAYSPDGARVVTGGDDNVARIWDVASGRELMRLSGHTDRVWGAAFAPDGKRVVTASEDRTARIWDAETGKELLRLSGHADRVNCAAYSPDGARVVTASDDRSIRLWDATTGEQLARLSGHTDRVWSAQFSADGARVVSASTDQTARVWDVAPREVLRLSGHQGRIWYAAYSPDGSRAVTASYDHTGRIWDTASGQELARLTGHTMALNSATFSADGRRVVTASDDKTVRIWDAVTGKELMQLNGHTDRTSGAAFSPDGTRVVTASLDATARIWDTRTGQTVKVLSGHKDRVEAAAFSPDGRRIVTASNDGTARIWDAITGRTLLILRGHTRMLGSAVYSADGRRIITASEDKTARIWDAANGRELVRLVGHSEAVNFADFSADGRRAVTASSDRTARIWDTATGQQILLLNGHTGPLSSAAFSPDGRRILTASEDMSARIWDAAALPLDVQIGWARAAQFDPLQSAERYQLGLPVPVDARRWPADPSACDQAAGAPYDPDRRAPGVMLEQIVADVAVAACADRAAGVRSRTQYQHGRALWASGDVAGARRDLEAAVAANYRSAGIDLARLLSQPSAGMLDLNRAVALYEHAWAEGVTVAGFALGSLYEQGVTPAAPGGSMITPDSVKAWAWYRKAASAREPNSLARFAEKAGTDVSGVSLLESFKYYAAAAHRAELEDWPLSEWKDWRYHQASLARLLARAGQTQEVARAYDEIRLQ